MTRTCRYTCKELLNKSESRRMCHICYVQTGKQIFCDITHSKKKIDSQFNLFCTHISMKNVKFY